MERYSRQVLFSGIGRQGQERLSLARVVIIGCGALGSVAAEMIVRAGIGHLTLIDRDFVELSNLQRQSLFTEADARDAVPKAVAAQRALGEINSEVRVAGLVDDLTHRNIEAILLGADLILDGSDNFEVRFLANDYCAREGVPWVYAAAVGSYGLALPVLPGKTPCLRCILENPPEPGTAETCETAGILAPVIHAISAFQVSHAFRILLGVEPSPGIFRVDVWRDTWRWIPLQGPRPDCPCCGQRRFDFLSGRRHSRAAQLCGRNAVQVSPVSKKLTDLKELGRRLEGKGELRVGDHLLQFRVGSAELTVFPDGRAIIKGVEDIAAARALYARYIGN